MPKSKASKAIVSSLDKKCDGIFHCLYGEDEKFETCKDTYPEEATIKCIENRAPGIDLWIKAIPCNGIRECRDGRDEECEDDKLLMYFILSGLFLLTFSIYQYLTWIKIPQWKQVVLTKIQSTADDGRNPEDCIGLKGNALANLKVYFLHFNLF